jgi:hypothetical protein
MCSDHLREAFSKPWTLTRRGLDSLPMISSLAYILPCPTDFSNIGATGQVNCVSDSKQSRTKALLTQLSILSTDVPSPSKQPFKTSFGR